MKSRPPIIQADGEMRNLSAADMKWFKPAKEVLELELYQELVAMNKAAKDVPRSDESWPLGAWDTQAPEIDSSAIGADCQRGAIS